MRYRVMLLVALVMCLAASTARAQRIWIRHVPPRPTFASRLAELQAAAYSPYVPSYVPSYRYQYQYQPFPPAYRYQYQYYAPPVPSYGYYYQGW